MTSGDPTAISTSTRRTANKTLENHQKISYNQPMTMKEQEEEKLQPGVNYLYDETGKMIGVLSEEECERARKDFDEEFMCAKPMASLLRLCREQQKKTS